MKCIKVFIASSIVEFKEEREKIQMQTSIWNNKFIDRQEAWIRLTLSDYFDKSYVGRKQNQINEEIIASDIIFFLFGTNAGEYTLEELDVAIEQFDKEQSPRIYTYFKDTDQTDSSINQIKNKLSNLGHYYEMFTNTDGLLLNILNILDNFIYTSKTLKNLSIQKPEVTTSNNTEKNLSSFEEQMKEALNGNIESMYKIGLMYDDGKGVSQDKAKAIEWYTKAANLGHAQAQYNIGIKYFTGKDLDHNDTKAAEWFTKAANQGYARAQYNLGNMYKSGRGIHQDKVKAVEWYNKAANQGYARAQFNLGVMYESGQGVTQDKVKAIEWYTKAANQEDIKAQDNLGRVYEHGIGVPQDNTKAVEWYTKAANQGYAISQGRLGYMYDRGKGVPKDNTKAVEWYTKAANQGDAIAQFNLGLMYSNGQGVPQDNTKAVEWYTKAANQNDKDAMRKLGLLYQKGDGIPKNDQLAYEYFLQAANLGDTTSMDWIGYFNEKGIHVSENIKTAKKWYNKSGTSYGKKRIQAIEKNKKIALIKPNVDTELKLLEEKKYSSSTVDQMNNILNLIDTAIKGTQIASDYEYYIQELNFAIKTYTNEAIRSGDLTLYPRIHDWKAREYLANEELSKLKK